MTNTMRLLGGAGITALFLPAAEAQLQSQPEEKEPQLPAAGAHLRLGTAWS